MPRKPAAARRPRTPAPAERSGVTPERFRRLCQLLRLIAARPHSREALGRRLRLDIRGFYRDLEVVRQAGVPITLEGGEYRLAEPLAAALDRLPFPDPLLTFGEARQLARGKSAAHRRLQQQISDAAR